AGYEQNEKWATELRETLGTQSLRFNLVYSNSVELPSLPGLNSAETMAAGTMIQAICTNDATRTWSNLLLAVDLVRLLDENPDLFVYLHRVAMANIGVGATWEALHSGNLNGAQLAELQAK